MDIHWPNKYSMPLKSSLTHEKEILLPNISQEKEDHDITIKVITLKSNKEKSIKIKISTQKQFENFPLLNVEMALNNRSKGEFPYSVNSGAIDFDAIRLACEIIIQCKY